MNPKRSLTFLLFLLLTLGGFLVIGANRVSAEYLIEVDLQLRIQQEMRDGIAACVGLLGQKVAFLTCYREHNANKTTRVLSDAFVFCGVGVQAADKRSVDTCQAVSPKQVNWIPKQAEDDFLRNFHKQSVWSREWTGMQISPEIDGPRVLLPKKAIDDFLSELWSYRNRQLMYLLPLIFTIFLFVAVVTIGVLMAPIRALENSLTRMSADNLDRADGLYSKYREFDSLTKMYLDLRHRLEESFRKARNFTADASHELKTPLTILRGNAERLIAELPTGAPVQLRASEMAGEVERLIDITEKLLTLSRADSKALLTQRTDFNLSSFLEELAEDAASFHEGISVETSIERGVIWNCDPVLIKQLVRNLYSNAMKYNVPQGRIQLELQRLGDALELTITNSSSHLSENLATHAFDRFFRGDASHNRGVDGLGLGLSICLEIANAHKGTLQFRVLDPETVALKLNAPLNF